MFQSVSSPALQSTRIKYAKPSSGSYFPITVITTISVLSKPLLQSPRKITSLRPVQPTSNLSHTLSFLLLPLLSYFVCYFFPHRSSERVGLSLQHTSVPSSSPYIIYETCSPRTAFKILTSCVTKFTNHVLNCFHSALSARAVQNL